MKHLCFINGKAIVLPKIVCVGRPFAIDTYNNYRLEVHIVGDEQLNFYNDTLEESLSERDKLIAALEVMYAERENQQNK